MYLSVDDSQDSSGAGGVYKSLDDGTTWSQVLSPDNPAIPAFERPNGAAKVVMVDNQDSSGKTVIAGLRGSYSLYMSSDGGANWAKQTSQTSSSPPAPHWRAHPWFGTMYAFDQGSNGTLYAGHSRGASVYGHDQGSAKKQWLDRSAGIGNIVVNDVELDPADTSTAYMAMADVAAPFKTTDRGKTWVYINKGFDVCRGTSRRIDKVRDIAVAKLNPQILFATGYAKGKDDTTICKSVDGGSSWTPVCNGLPASTPSSKYNILSVEVSPTDNNIVLMATNETKIYRSKDGGVSWQFIVNISPTRSKFEFTDNGETVVIGGHTDVHISNNAGLIWKPSTPSPGLAVYSVDVCPTNSDKLVAGVNIRGAVKSDDQGDTWHKIFGEKEVRSHPDFVALSLSDYARSSYANTVSAVRFGAADCGTVYLAHRANSPHYGLGLFRSTNKGETWKKISTRAIFESIRVFDLADDASAIVVGGLEMGFGYK